MFSLFKKKKTEEEKLQEKYADLMKQAFQLSVINRSASDTKYAEADAVLKQLDQLKKAN
jgi:hypothetical protein